MGGFTNEELDEINLGKDFNYPDISAIEDKANVIVPKLNKDNSVLKIIIVIMIFMLLFICILAYFNANGMKITNLLKTIAKNIHSGRGKVVSSRTMIVPK